MPPTAAAFVRDSSGTIAVLSAITIPLAVLVVAVAMTTADAYNVQSKTQQALDAAVISAASAPYDVSDDARIALAQRIYSANGSSRADGAPQISLASKPAATFTISNTVVYGTVEATMNSPFLGVLGKDVLNLKVTSAARRQIGAPVCVIGLDPSEDATMDFNGQARLTVDFCATQTNSAHGAGMNQVGHPTMTAKQIGVTGGFTGTDYSPMPINGTTPIADPYASLQQPLAGPCHALSGAMLQQSNTTLTPGTYCGGLNIKASSIVTLRPGVYIFQDGPLTIDSQAQVTGDRVMLAFLGKSSVLYLIGGASLTVTSPMDGTYANIQFFGDRKLYNVPGGNGVNGNSMWFTVIGDSRLTYDGVLYAPQFHVWLAGGSIVQGKSPSYIAVAKKLWFQDRTQVTFTQVNTRGLTVEASVQLQYGTALFH